ncbi:unnamed protein product [Closterium sp. NIES-53]
MFLSLYDNLFTHAPHMLLTSEAIKTELYGNPLCSPYRLEVSQVCLPPEPFPDFTFPSFCANLDCNPRYRPNFPLYHRDHTCECVSAMEVQLRLPASQYSVFSEDLVNTFRGRIRFSLRRLGVNMTWTQIIISTITTAVLTDSDITMSILFFPPLDDITWQRQPAISQPEMIRNAFDSHRVILGSDLGPYRILGYYNPDAPPANVTSQAPPASGGVSIAVVVGIVAAGVAILALLLVGLTWLLLHRQKRQGEL